VYPFFLCPIKQGLHTASNSQTCAQNAAFQKANQILDIMQNSETARNFGMPKQHATQEGSIMSGETFAVCNAAFWTQVYLLNSGAGVVHGLGNHEITGFLAG
jgi:hypothetical protein